MANEFKVKNGLIVIGDLTTSGTITINGALAATQSWVTSQAYLTSASLSGYATQSYVTSAIASLVNSAPAALDTLNELAAALGNDASFSTTITNSIASKQAQLNGTGLVRMSGTSVSYDNTTYLVSNFGNIEGDHSYGYPSSEGWYKIAEVVLNGTCQSYNLWGEYRDTGYFDNSHYRIHITARAECDFPSNNESHAINVNIYGSSTNETYFSNNVRVVLTQSSSDYRKYELQYYRATWDTGSWRLQTLGWTTYTTSQTAGSATGTPRVYYVSKFSTDNIFVANRLSIGTTYAGFAANIAGTTYIIGASAWVNDGYGITNASSPGTGFFPYSDGNSVISSNNTTRLFVNGSTGNIGIGTSSPSYKLHINGTTYHGDSVYYGGWGFTTWGTINGNYAVNLQAGSGNYLNFGTNGTTGRMVIDTAGNVGIGTTSPNDKLHVVASTYNGITITTPDVATLKMRSSAGGTTSWGFATTNLAASDFGIYESNSAGGDPINAGTARLYFKTGGNVGIGTTNPGTKLHVVGNAWINRPSNKIDNNTATEFGSRVEFNNAFASGQSGYMMFRYPTYNNFLISGDYDGNIGGAIPNIQFGKQSTVYMHINSSDGNVGIGITNPSYKLQVAGSAYVNGGTLFLDSDQYLRWGNSNQGIVGSNDNHVSIVSGGATRQSIYADGRTYFPGLDLSISNVNSSHGTGTYFRGSSSHFVLGLTDGNTLYLNYGNSGGSLRTFGTWYHESTQILSTSRVLTNVSGNISMFTNDAGYLTSVSDVWVNTTGDTMTGALTIQGGWASTILDGDNVVLRKPNYSSGGWARTLLNFQEYDTTSLFQIGGYGNNNTMTYGYLGSAYNTPTIKWYANKNVAFSGNIIIDDAADNNRYQKGGSFLNLRDPWDNIHFSNNGGGIYVDSPIHYWRSGSGSTYWMTLVSNCLGIGTTNPVAKLHAVGSSTTELRLQNADANNNYGFVKYETSVAGVGGNLVIGTNASGGGYGAIGFSNNNNVEFVGNGDIYLVKGGNVGIGTYSPGYKLHVAGDGYFSTTLTIGSTTNIAAAAWLQFNGANVLLGEGTNTYLQANGGGSIIFRNNSTTELMRITNGGNVGIGTSSPTALLHVANSGRMLGVLRIQGTNRTSFYDNTFAVNNDGGGADGFIYGSNVGGSFPFDGYGEVIIQANPRTGYSNGISLVTGTTSPSIKVRVTEAGNVGIGTTNPGAKLEVVGNNNVLSVVSQTGDTSLPTKNIASFVGVYNNGGNGHQLYINSTAELGPWEFNMTKTWGGYLTFGVSGDGTARTRALYVNSNGYVGVNVNPISGDRFEVAGSVRIHTGNNWDAIQIYSDGANGYIQGLGDETGLRIRSEYGNILLADNRGKVGIGTSSPSEELHVLGRGIFDGGSGNSSTDAVLYVTKSTNDDWGLYVNNAGLDYGMYTRVSSSAAYAFAIHNGTTWTTRITGNAIIYLGEKNAIEGNYDSWLRLNNSNHYASGVYTPGVMRADGGFQVSGSTVWHAGNDGSGSGLDADLLDGQDSSTFLRILSGGSEANLDSYIDNGVRSVSFTGHSQHLLSWNVGGSTGTIQQLFHYGVPNNGWKIRNKTDNSSWSDWGYVVMASSNQGLISGTIATQSWVGSQSYATTSYVTTQINNLINGAPGALDTLDELAAALGDDSNFATTVTNSIASKLSLSGGTMTGQILFQTSALNNGFRWDVNSDAAGITFKNTGDGDANSYFNFFTEDNGNEYFKFSHNTWNIGSFDFMDVKNGVVRTNGDIYVNASQSGSRSAGTNELINGSRVWHSGDFSSTNISNWNTAYGWGNHASAGYAAASSLANYLPLAGGTMSGSINMNGNNVINIGQVNATHAIFTNNGSSRVMYLRGSGNIIQFQDAAATDKWEIVGRDGEFYVYKSDGAGSGYKWRIDGVGNHTITGNLTVTGTITESSSLKLKENVETSEGNLEKVVNLRPVTYNKIGSQTTELGLIAEEVAEVYPEFVQYDENGDPIGVHYSRLTAALIGAVKELTKRIETLENNG